MSGSAVLIHCAESEAFGWVILEAMNVGLPVVCSAVDGPKEIIEHEKTGFLVSTGDIKNFAGTVIRVMKNSELRKNIVSQAHDRLISKFSARQMVESIAALYKQIAYKNSLNE
jgi:glycosyltransferase involved in cell wall biosynthesis